jgi:uncharacterized membrane protein HdeD (DUF308 family)
MSQIEALHQSCSLESNWWIFSIRGILALMFGSLALLMPVAAVLTLTLAFGAYATIDGAFHLVSGISLARKGRRWAGLVVGGSLGILAGLVTLIAPQLASFGLTAFLWTMVSLWAIATGVMAIASAMRLRRESQGGGFLALIGGLSMLLGAAMQVLFWLNPAAAMPLLGLVIAFNSLVSGVMLLMLAFRLVKLEKPATSG